MSESEYWELLRFRINSLPSSACRPPLPGYCDWFEPKCYVLGGPSPRITGCVGFVNGRNVWKRTFTLLVGRLVGSPNEIEWATLLPQEGSSAWVSCNEKELVIEIDHVVKTLTISIDQQT